MGFLFRAYEPRPNYYHGHLGGTPNPSQPHYPHHSQHHGYDYLTQPGYPEQYSYPNQYPYPYPYDHGNFGHQPPYSSAQQYQQYNHYQQVPIPYQPFIYDTRYETHTHSVDAPQSE